MARNLDETTFWSLSIDYLEFGQAVLRKRAMHTRTEDNCAKVVTVLEWHPRYCGFLYWRSIRRIRADVFSLGCIFYAILERKCIQCDNGEACYAAFVTVSGSQLGLGEAMFHDPVFSDVGRQLSFRNTKDRLLKKMTCDALERDPDDRPSAEAISCGIELICSDESLI